LRRDILVLDDSPGHTQVSVFVGLSGRSTVLWDRSCRSRGTFVPRPSSVTGWAVTLVNKVRYGLLGTRPGRKSSVGAGLDAILVTRYAA